MLWKIVKLFNSTFFPKKQIQWSMTIRLALMYTLSAFCILMICALTLYWIFTSRLEQENYRLLQSEIIILKNILQTQVNSNEKAFRDALFEEVVLEPAISHFYVRLIDDQGHSFMETPKMNALIPSSEFNDISLNDPNVYPTKYWMTYVKNRHGKHFLLIAAYFDKPGKFNQAWRIQIAKDISSEHAIIVDYRRGLLLVLLLGVLGSGIVGILLTRKALQPLRDMTHSAEKITIARLQERLEPSSWPKELSSLATAFNNMLDRIEEGFTRLSQFSGDLAHELRTPITNLMGEAEICLLSSPRTNSEYREVLESSIEELSRLAMMIENILFLARAENPQMVMNISTVCLQTLLKNISDFYEAAAIEKNVKLFFDAKNLTVNADSLMLRRVINNLVSNALKYSNAGDQITLSAERQKDKIAISIQDQGQGISAEHLPHLFDRFYRVDSARSQQTGGTGLGLSIVKFIVELHKGYVSIVSEVNKGTKVTVYFPVCHLA